MKTLYESLEFNKIQEELKQYCKSSYTYKLIDDLHINDDQEELEILLRKTFEAMSFINIKGRLPLNGFVDLTYILEKTRRDGRLEGIELLDVLKHLLCVHDVKSYIKDVETSGTYIPEMIHDLEMNDYLLEEIQRCIEDDGRVADTASDQLFTIRRRIESIAGSLRKRIESMSKEYAGDLSLDNFTSRNDRYVLPVKANHKGKVKGLVRAYSSTGQTVYIEPEEIVVMNNELDDLRIEEMEEVNKILYRLSQAVKKYVVHFTFNLEILRELDFVFAKGYYGVEHFCCIAQIGDELKICKARHPLIDENKVVANDIYLNGARILVITGSNTGGKTVTLKTAGLLSLMTLSGLPVPADDAVIPMFDEIYTDLSDEQSIEQSLSTFSSHMSKIKQILDIATKHSLVLLDEIGSGTDPLEGESLAQAILDAFIRIGCVLFTSTHYHALKTYAKEQPQIISASVDFDTLAFKPTYKLKLDSVGESYAIEIAHKLGLNDSIVEHARSLKESQMSEHEKLMEKLVKKEKELENLEVNLLDSQKLCEQLKKDYNQKIKQYENNKKLMMEKAQNEANKIIKETKDNINLIIEELKLSSLKQHEIIDAKHDLDSLIVVKEEKVKKQDHVLRVGDHVMINSMKREGDIIELNKNHMITISISGLPVKLHEDDVTYMHPKSNEKKVKAIRKPNIKRTGSYEVNIVGERYDDAMKIVDKFLDDALLLGYPHVRIIHGIGTGALRKGVRQMLERNKSVVSYRDGGENEGGLGATLAYFE